MALRHRHQRLMTDGIVRLAVATLVSILPAISMAQDDSAPEVRFTFESSCAACHQMTNQKQEQSVSQTNDTMDLVHLRKRHEGRFPFWHVYWVIDGRQPVTAHGSREHPVWGDQVLLRSAGAERVTRSRVLEIVRYLESLQQE